MKRVATILFISFSLVSYGQQIEVKDETQIPHSQQYSVLKINVLGVFTKRLGIAVEHSFGKKFSGQLMFESGQYAKLDASAIGDNYKVSGYSIIPEIRIYPFREIQKSTEG